MPWRCHRSHAVTGALCLAVATRIDGSVAAAFTNGSHNTGLAVDVEHPAGTLRVECEGQGEEFVTSVMRTARLLFKGHVYLPEKIFHAVQDQEPVETGRVLSSASVAD